VPQASKGCVRTQEVGAPSDPGVQIPRVVVFWFGVHLSGMLVRFCYSSCGMPGSGQARTCVDSRCIVTHSEGRAPGIGCQAPHLHPLQPVRVHEGEAGQRQHTQL